jgi:hypothetical protein
MVWYIQMFDFMFNCKSNERKIKCELHRLISAKKNMLKKINGQFFWFLGRQLFDGQKSFDQLIIRHRWTILWSIKNWVGKQKKFVNGLKFWIKYNLNQFNCVVSKISFLIFCLPINQFIRRSLSCASKISLVE